MVKEFCFLIAGHNGEGEPLKVTAPRGCYIHGEVGTGKTILLDLMYDCLPEGAKKRVHFHNFMLYLYSEFNKWNLCSGKEANSMSLIGPNEYIANKLMEDARVICFDEVQVADYASCSLLEGVFQSLFSKGAIVIATSNRAIEDLGDLSISESSDGEHPIDSVFESIRSFKGLLQSHCASIHLDSDHDYRTSLKEGKSTYSYPITDENEEWLDQAFSQAIGGGQSLGSRFLNVYGRKILVPISSNNGVARFTAKELFDQPLGPADFIQICNNYDTIFVDRIPKMGMPQRNQARRFLSFIDAAYESKVKVYATAESKAEDLFTLLPRDGDEKDKYDDQMHFEMIGEIAYDLALSNLDFRALGIITGDDEIFSFKRAISRLKEMQSLLYQMRPHRKQFFDPYTGSKEERENALDNRRSRMVLRQKLLDEIEANKSRNDEFAELRDTIDDVLRNNPSGEMQEQSLKKRYEDMDWGDEASYRTWSQTVAEKSKYDDTVQKLTEKLRSKGPKPKFGEEHFWGFGWWKKAIKRITDRDPEDKDK